MLHACNSNAQEAKGGGSLHIWQQQPGLHSDAKPSLDDTVRPHLNKHSFSTFCPQTQPPRFNNSSATAQSLGQTVKRQMMNAILDSTWSQVTVLPDSSLSYIGGLHRRNKGGKCPADPWGLCCEGQALFWILLKTTTVKCCFSAGLQTYSAPLPSAASRFLTLVEPWPLEELHVWNVFWGCPWDISLL